MDVRAGRILTRRLRSQAGNAHRPRFHVRFNQDIPWLGRVSKTFLTLENPTSAHSYLLTKSTKRRDWSHNMEGQLNLIMESWNLIKKEPCCLCSAPDVTVVHVPSGYDVVRDCPNCIRYLIGERVVQRIREGSPTLAIRQILPSLSQAARRVAQDGDAGKEPGPELMDFSAILDEGLGWLLFIDEEVGAAEIAAAEQSLEGRES